MESGIQPVMNMGNDGLGLGGFGGIIGLLAVLGIISNGGFGGLFGGNAAANLATQNDVQRGFDALNLQDQSRDILGAVTSGTAQSVAATNQTFHDTLAVVTDKYGELQRDIAALQVAQAQALANQNECCCETKMLVQERAAATDAAIAQNRYEAAMGMAAMEQRITSKMDQNEIQSLRDQLSDVRLAQALNGVVRYPTATTYGVPSPCFGAIGCGNI